MKKNSILNDIDKKILAVLQDNADIPIAELSKKVNLSATPCWARINKLYKQGYILKKVAVVDRLKLNLNVEKRFKNPNLQIPFSKEKLE